MKVMNLETPQTRIGLKAFYWKPEMSSNLMMFSLYPNLFVIFLIFIFTQLHLNPIKLAWYPKISWNVYLPELQCTHSASGIRRSSWHSDSQSQQPRLQVVGQHDYDHTQSRWHTCGWVKIMSILTKFGFILIKISFESLSLYLWTLEDSGNYFLHQKR